MEVDEGIRALDSADGLEETLRTEAFDPLEELEAVVLMLVDLLEKTVSARTPAISREELTSSPSKISPFHSRASPDGAISGCGVTISPRMCRTEP